MFTEHDVKSIFSLFPPHTSADFIPQFAIASSGNGFVTLQFAQAQFRSRVTKETERISVSALASHLDISTTLVLQLVRSHPKLCLLSADQGSVIPIGERDSLREKLAILLTSGLHSKADFIAQHDIWPKSLDALLTDQDDEIMHCDSYICTRAYETMIANDMLSKVKQALSEIQTAIISPDDLSGSPPAWFMFRTLEKALESEALTCQVNIEQHPDRVTCTPKQLVESKRAAILESLKCGALAYLDLQKFATEYSELVPSYEDAVSYFQNIKEVDIIDAFAVSKPWVSQIEQESQRILEQEGCTLDVTEYIGSRLPPNLIEPTVAKIKNSVISASAQRSEQEKIVRVGHLILSEARRNDALDELAMYAKADADTQWQALRNDPNRTEDIKFSRDRIRDVVPKAGLVQRLLTDEKSVERLLDDTFWTAISGLEATNESDFAVYWTDRVVARFHVYRTGVSHVGDQKLHDQLAEVLASYVHKEVVPETIAKARAQGLMLSRKTRKNVARLSSILDSTKTIDIPGIAAALEKFSKKQGITAPADASLGAAKQSMVHDMLRRLQKQKASDGPVLFLMLVIILFAKHYDGVVYATGKFAPKLLKHLKGNMEPEQYEKVERWKEAAKASSLTAEHRADMVKMAEAKAVVQE